MKRILLPILVIGILLLAACAAPSVPTASEEPTSTPEWHSGRVWTSDGAYIVGSCNKPIVLIDNPSAVNPTYKQLLAFLKYDNTESHPYTGDSCFAAIPCPPERWDVLEKLNEDYEQAKAEGREYDTPSLCSEYAEMLHNNAEEAGIRASFVICTDHAMNAFETVDRGLVFIDCTGFVWSFDGIDKIATIDSNGKVTLRPLWPQDNIDYCDVFFGKDVYFEEIVWEGE